MCRFLRRKKGEPAVKEPLEDKQEELPEDFNKYPLPLYLNQKYVFGVLATLEDGLSSFEIVKQTSTEQEEVTTEIGGELGVRNVFGFLGVSLQGGREKGREIEKGEESTREKIHTPDSLFAKMREGLYRENLVRSSFLTSADTGNFVEFKITLQKNPLIDALETIDSLWNTAVIFSKPGGKNKERLQTERVIRQLEKLIEQLKGPEKEGTFDLIGKAKYENINVVLTLDKSFLSDPSLLDLLDGEYTVLGKVTKIIRKSTEGKINLLRKTSLGKVQGSFFEGLANMGSQESGISIPKIITEIEAPAVQIIPIAIFA